MGEGSGEREEGRLHSGRHIISLLISFRAIYCLHTMCLPVFSPSHRLLPLCLCVAYLHTGIRSRSSSSSGSHPSLPPPTTPSLLVASLIDKFSIKVIFKCRKTQDRSLPGSGEDMEEGERRGTCASLCQDNVLVIPDKVINSYVLAARVASSFHASCPSN